MASSKVMSDLVPLLAPLAEKLIAHHSDADLQMLVTAFDTASQRHDGQFRK